LGRGASTRRARSRLPAQRTLAVARRADGEPRWKQRRRGALGAGGADAGPDRRARGPPAGAGANRGSRARTRLRGGACVMSAILNPRQPAAEVGGIEAPLRRTFSLVRGAGARLALTSALGACAVGAGIGLIATSAWLISRASQRPPESALA